MLARVSELMLAANPARTRVTEAYQGVGDETISPPDLVSACFSVAVDEVASAIVYQTNVAALSPSYIIQDGSGSLKTIGRTPETNTDVMGDSQQ